MCRPSRGAADAKAHHAGLPNGVSDPICDDTTNEDGEMELRDFVKTTLTDILTSIVESRKAEGIGGLIAPSGIGGHKFPADSGVMHESRSFRPW
jgi:hypothetical protein